MNFIVNPTTLKRYEITSVQGKLLLKKYLKYFNENQTGGTRAGRAGRKTTKYRATPFPTDNKTMREKIAEMEKEKQEKQRNKDLQEAYKKGANQTMMSLSRIRQEQERQNKLDADIRKGQRETIKQGLDMEQTEKDNRYLNALKLFKQYEFELDKNGALLDKLIVLTRINLEDMSKSLEEIYEQQQDEISMI